MKQLFLVYGITLIALFLNAEVKPNADVYFSVTDDLPKLKTEPTLWYHGILSVTNTGDVAFVVITHEMMFCEAARFYREGDDAWQRVEDETARGKQRRESERKNSENEYYSCLEENVPTKMLQPGESISFECQCHFIAPFSTPVNIYKAEMYLGHGTWVPIHITPTLGFLLPVGRGNKGMSPEDFYYSQEGTNQYLYVKEGDNFKRVSEMKLKSRPEKDDKDGALIFDMPDSTKKKLTREQARQIIHEREQRKKQK